MWILVFALASGLLALLAVAIGRSPRERSCVACGEPLAVSQTDCPVCTRGR